MPVYVTPGVYRQPQPAQSDDLRLVRTDVAGFVGFAERGPLPPPGATPEEAAEAAVRLTSWADFTATFGGFVPYSYLAYAVRAFFDNKGTTCYVVRVAELESTVTLLPATRSASYPLPGSQTLFAGLLSAPGQKGDTVLQISDDSVGRAAMIRTGDLIEIESDGVTEVSLVIARTGNIVQLAQKLAGAHPEGTILAKYEPSLIVTARSPGSWGNRIKLTVTPLTAGPMNEEFALRITLKPGPDPSAPIEEEYYSHLSVLEGPFFVLDRINNLSNLVTFRSVAAPSEIPPLFVGAGPLAPGQTLLNLVASPAALFLQGGEDGLSRVTIGDFTGGPYDLRGLRILEEIDEVAILCAPDAVYEPAAELPTPGPPVADPCAPPPEALESPSLEETATVELPMLDPVLIYRAMIDQCERLRDRVAILDYPQSKKVPADLQNWKNQFVTRFGAIYYPWLEVPDSLELEGSSRRVPAAGHIAGVYAGMDNQFGVARPPANAEIAFVNDVTDDVTDLAQQNLNPFGINAIRSFPGRGIRVWGARSLAGPDDDDWRFIHVRRLMSMIEKSIAVSTRWAVFEPNDFSLRRTLAHSLSVFLEAIWRTGGLKGARPADGYYVKCDATNNPPTVVDAGRLICEIGVAVAAPMEFLVFEIHQDPDGSSVSES